MSYCIPLPSLRLATIIFFSNFWESFPTPAAHAKSGQEFAKAASNKLTRVGILLQLGLRVDHPSCQEAYQTSLVPPCTRAGVTSTRAPDRHRSSLRPHKLAELSPGVAAHHGQSDLPTPGGGAPVGEMRKKRPNHSTLTCKEWQLNACSHKILSI